MHRAISSKRTVLVIATSLIFCGLSFLHAAAAKERGSEKKLNPITTELRLEASRGSLEERARSLKALSDRLDTSKKRLELLEIFKKTDLNPDVLRELSNTLDNSFGAPANAYAGSMLNEIRDPVSKAPARARQKREDLTRVLNRYSETIYLMRYENAELREQIAWIRFKDAAGMVEASPEFRQEQQNAALKLYEVWRLSNESLETAERKYAGMLRLDMPGPQIDAANKRLEMAKIFMRFGYELLDSGNQSDGQAMMKYARGGVCQRSCRAVHWSRCVSNGDFFWVEHHGIDRLPISSGS